MNRESLIGQDKIEALLARYKNDQREFESHPLWHELDTTPTEFFMAVDDFIARNGIPRKEWEAKVDFAKQRCVQSTVLPAKTVKKFAGAIRV